jgi:hypothetical protein
VPPPDPRYLQHVQERIIDAAVAAKEAAAPAELAITRAQVRGVGRNRLAPDGPMDHEVGLIYVRRAQDRAALALALVYGMHPTVLHEDSTLVSSDFPHYARAQIEEQFPGITVVYHNGPCGNLSPRYDVTGQTFAEAERLGRALGRAVTSAIATLEDPDFAGNVDISVANEFVTLPARQFPSLGRARRELAEAQATFERLNVQAAAGAVPRAAARTAECVLFGKQFQLRIVNSGRLEQVLRERYGRVEVQAVRLNDTYLVALPGELFVEYGLEIKRRAPGRTFVITMANGDLQGYIVTPQADADACYEASFSAFRPEAGAALVESALRLLKCR